MPNADLDARSRRWAVTNDPALLWPDLDVRLLPAAAKAIERAVAQVLDGRNTSLGAPNGADAHAIGIAALISGTGPLLGYWVELGQLDVSAPLALLLARHLRHGRGRVRRIGREITPALRNLVDAGVEPGILKGFHTAHVYYPEPGVRPLSDVDVYVEPRLVGLASTALASAGFGPGTWSAEFKTNWYPRGRISPIRSLEFWHVRSPWGIELHSALEFGALVRHGIRLERTIPVAEPWTWNAFPLRVAPQPLRFVAVAAHLSQELHAARLIRLIELTLMIRRDIPSGELNWHALTDFLEQTGATSFAYPALALVEQLAPGTIDDALLAKTRMRATRIARAVVADLTPATPLLHERVSLAERLMWETGVIAIMRRFFRMLVPIGGRSAREDVTIYWSRVVRLLTGRVTWRLGSRARKSTTVRV